MSKFEFKVAGEILRAFSDEKRVRILRRLFVREEPILTLVMEERIRDEAVEANLALLERSGLVERRLRGELEYARISPKLSGIVRNYFALRN